MTEEVGRATKVGAAGEADTEGAGAGKPVEQDQVQIGACYDRRPQARALLHTTAETQWSTTARLQREKELLALQVEQMQAELEAYFMRVREVTRALDGCRVELQTAQTERDAYLASLQQARQERADDAQPILSQEDFSAVQRELRTAKRLLRYMTRSRSWRVTAPLRRLAKPLRRQLKIHRRRRGAGSHPEPAA